MSRRVPLQVELPPPGADQPVWAKVGVIAAVCFGIGVLWPRLAGWHIGPMPPQDGRPAAVSSSMPGPAKTAPTGSGGAKMPALSASAPNGASTNEETVVVSTALIVKCRDTKGKTPDKCDELALDPLFSPRLKELSKCPSAIGLSGKVTLGFELDFKKKSIKVQRAKAKLPRTTVDGITRCAEKGLAGVSLDDLTHESVRYSVDYTLAFFPPGKTPDESAVLPESSDAKDDKPEAPAADGAKTAEIVWNSTQVRNAPKNGDVIARLVRGNKVRILETKDGWLKVQFGDKEGWIYKPAASE